MVAGKLYLQPPYGLSLFSRIERPEASGRSSVDLIIKVLLKTYGELAQLARALAWHARGHRFDSVILHSTGKQIRKF